jgi:hypothetical protein
MPDTVKDREGEARQEMLESLADFDDVLLEQLLEDTVPATGEVFDQLAKDLREDLIVPVLFGSAEASNGITRLWKALRHEAPQPAVTAERLQIPAGGDLAASVFRIMHLPHTGRMTLARVWRGQITDGMTIGDERVSGLFRMMGGESQKTASAGEGEAAGAGLRARGAAAQPSGRSEAHRQHRQADRGGRLDLDPAQRRHPPDADLGSGRDPPEDRDRAPEEQVQRRGRGVPAADRLQGDDPPSSATFRSRSSRCRAAAASSSSTRSSAARCPSSTSRRSKTAPRTTCNAGRWAFPWSTSR